MVTEKHGDMVTQSLGEMETGRHQTENGSPGDVPLPVVTRKFVLCPFVDEETTGIYPVANRLN
jgi:hypothetical protein